MREIIFKAKRIDTGEWVEGYLLRDDCTGQCFIHASGNSVNESDKVNKEGCLRFVAFEVDESTICQYTGLTDKNGRKIWENDIVLEVQPCKRTFKITYDADAFCFDGHNIMLRVRNARDMVEVIGNVFDNPELLEKAR